MKKVKANDWKTTAAGVLAGVVYLIDGVVLPVLKDGVSLDGLSGLVQGVVVGLGLMGIGWFAKDKGAGGGGQAVVTA